jgi:AraC-like DNA-binding protein
MHRLFHREVGKTFRQHLLEVRMIRVANLVKQSAQPMKQIALDSGYNDLSNFYRDFRKIHGTTPRQLRSDHLLKQIAEYPDHEISFG